LRLLFSPKGGERMWAREIDRNKEKGEEREKRAAVTGVAHCSLHNDSMKSGGERQTLHFGIKWQPSSTSPALSLFKPFPHRTLSHCVPFW
ncbi:hypothetical protein KUCAC02_033884, partial [Chaenocephalus aceratus]